MRLLKFPLSLTIVFVSLFFISCDDDITELGTELLPSSDKFTGLEIDSLTITARQFEYKQDLSNSNYAYLGIATDPYFGEIKASVFNDLTLEEKPANYDTLIKTVDSVELYLYFDATMYRLDSNNNSLSLEIYRMIDSLETSTTYDSTFNKNKYYNSSSLLTSKDIDIQDKIVKIKMPSSSYSYFQKIVDLDSAKLYDKYAIHKAGVYGLVFNPVNSAGNGIIARLNTADTKKTYLDIYYHINTTSPKTSADTTISDYVKMSLISHWTDTVDYTSDYYGNAKANLITYDYTKSSVSTSLNGSTNDSLFYVLGEAGQIAVLNFSNLTNLAALGKYNVIKADLFIPYKEEFYYSNNQYSTKLPITDLGLYVSPKTDSFVYYSTAFDYMKYTPTMDTIGNFKFDVTEYVQLKLNNPTTYNEFYISALSEGFNCAILKKNGIKLKIKYTKF
jgi:hypothetical protein